MPDAASAKAAERRKRSGVNARNAAAFPSGGRAERPKAKAERSSPADARTAGGRA